MVDGQIIGDRAYRGFALKRIVNGNSQNWHVFNGDGLQLTRLGFKSMAGAKRWVDRNR